MTKKAWKERKRRWWPHLAALACLRGDILISLGSSAAASAPPHPVLLVRWNHFIFESLSLVVGSTCTIYHRTRSTYVCIFFSLLPGCQRISWEPGYAGYAGHRGLPGFLAVSLVSGIGHGGHFFHFFGLFAPGCLALSCLVLNLLEQKINTNAMWHEAWIIVEAEGSFLRALTRVSLHFAPSSTIIFTSCHTPNWPCCECL